jgi:hypothetical protein
MKNRIKAAASCRAAAMKNLNRKQIIPIIVMACFFVAASLFIMSYFKPLPRDIILGRWKKVSANEDISIAFYADGKVFSYINGGRTYLGKYTFIDSCTVKFDYYFISSSYFKVKTLTRDSIMLTDEHGNASEYNRTPE